MLIFLSTTQINVSNSSFLLIYLFCIKLGKLLCFMYQYMECAFFSFFFLRGGAAGEGGMSHSLQDLSSPTRDWTLVMAVKAQSPNHWTTRKVPGMCFLLYFSRFQQPQSEVYISLPSPVIITCMNSVTIKIPLTRWWGSRISIPIHFELSATT